MNEKREINRTERLYKIFIYVVLIALAVSIIVPVYKVEKYLDRCVESIVNQTYENLEIILVDDGSPDNCPAMCDKWAEKDCRIKVIHKNNGGLSDARNAGMAIATGELMGFVDSDDWIDERTCELAVDTIQKTMSDIVMWSYVRELSGESRPKNIMEQDRVYEKHEIQQELYRRMYGVLGKELMLPENADALCTVWGKLYRRNIIEENQIVFFDIHKIGNYEDGLFNLDAFCCAKRVVFLNHNLYHYRRDNVASITSEYNTEIKNKKNVLYLSQGNFFFRRKSIYELSCLWLCREQGCRFPSRKRWRKHPSQTRMPAMSKAFYHV